MEDNQEYNIQKYELNQEGNDYILTTGLINDNIKITCRDQKELTRTYYTNQFSLSDLSSKNIYFKLCESIEAAQIEINKAIERQKCGVKEEGNIIIVFIYFTIGTDRTNLSLKLLKQEDELHQIKQEQPNYIGKSNLENRLNYPQDEQRLKNLEETSIGFKNTQDELHQQLEQLIQQSMQLINETYFLQEDNAKLKERIKIISTDNNLRKNDLIKLRNENRILKEENVKLNNDNSILEQKLKNKQENNVKDLEENNRKTQTIENNDPDDGPIARTTKFEKSEVQTFVSRPTIRPAGQSYQENNEFNNSMNDKGQFKNFSVKNS
jgi:hypothetical protein